METYYRHIVLRVRELHEEVVKSPTASFPTLIEALAHAEYLELLDRRAIENNVMVALAANAYEVIDLEHLTMGDMRKHFKVEDGKLTPVA